MQTPMLAKRGREEKEEKLKLLVFFFHLGNG